MNSDAPPLNGNSIWDDEPGPWETSAAQRAEPAGSVLILDDSKAQRLVLQSIFLEWGFKVLEADNGLDGLGSLNRAGALALILVDWKMPFMNGLEFVRAVRAQPNFASVPIIMMSGLNTAQHVRDGLEAGINDYLMKPFTKEDLMAKLEANGIDWRRSPD